MATFKHTGQYICTCGREFLSAQAFNGHKTHCKEHQLQKHGTLDIFFAANTKRAQSVSNSTPLRKIEREQQKLDAWLQEKHRCENCNKVMTEKYGSGRFCCSACAHSRKQSDETKEKISQSVHANLHKNTSTSSYISYFEAFSKYSAAPKFCSICGKQLTYEQRHRKTCSETCYRMRLSEAVNERIQNGTHNSWATPRTKSYPEKFWTQVLVNNNIEFEEQHKVNTPTTYYLLDFLLLGCIDLEIDGKQHLDEAHKKHDEQRNTTLQKMGFIVYRIPWIVPSKKNNEKIVEQINSFINFYNDIKRQLQSNLE